MVAYLTMAMSLFPDDDYEEVAAKVTGSLSDWGCWNAGGLERADRQRHHPGP